MNAWGDRPRPDALTLEFLQWLAGSARSYGETMEAWRTNCPRMPVWEDAVRAGLVALEGGGTMRERKVALTQAGRSLLKTARLATETVTGQAASRQA
jgi:hypothetical protein